MTAIENNGSLYKTLVQTQIYSNVGPDNHTHHFQNMFRTPPGGGGGIEGGSHLKMKGVLIGNFRKTP